MAFQISPGVNTSEIDLTTVVPGVSSVDAGFSGAFRWGPINEVTLIQKIYSHKDFKNPMQIHLYHFLPLPTSYNIQTNYIW